MDCSFEPADGDAELDRMRLILDQMVQCSAAEYDQFPEVEANKESISDDLLAQVLSEHLAPSPPAEDPGAHALETDTEPAHLQVIAEVQSGTPMQIDRLSATTRIGRAARGRAAKDGATSIHHVAPKRYRSSLEPPAASTQCTIPPPMLRPIEILHFFLLIF